MGPTREYAIVQQRNDPLFELEFTHTVPSAWRKPGSVSQMKFGKTTANNNMEWIMGCGLGLDFHFLEKGRTLIMIGMWRK